MPELPEVESFKRYVDKTSLQQMIETIRFAGKDLLLHTAEKKLRDMFTGNVLTVGVFLPGMSDVIRLTYM